MKVYEIFGEDLFEAATITPMRAREEIRKLAMKLKIASSELMLRYKKRLARFVDKAKALSQLEIDMNLTRGALKGFDTLYQTATA
jgi:hypothetical protein